MFSATEAYSGPCQASMVELFYQISERLKVNKNSHKRALSEIFDRILYVTLSYVYVNPVTNGYYSGG